MLTNTSLPQIGVVETPDLALTLTLLGFGVTGGGAFLDAAQTIRSHPDAALPVVIFDIARPGLRAWVDRTIATSRVVVLRGTPAGPIPTTTGSNIILPASINDVLAAAGWGPSPHPLGDALIQPDGRIPEVDQYRPAAPVVEVVEVSLVATAEAPTVTLLAAPTPPPFELPTAKVDIDLFALTIIEPVPVINDPDVSAITVPVLAVQGNEVDGNDDDEIPDWAWEAAGAPKPVSAFTKVTLPNLIPADAPDLTAVVPNRAVSAVPAVEVPELVASEPDVASPETLMPSLHVEYEEEPELAEFERLPELVFEPEVVAEPESFPLFEETVVEPAPAILPTLAARPVTIPTDVADFEPAAVAAPAPVAVTVAPAAPVQDMSFEEMIAQVSAKTGFVTPTIITKPQPVAAPDELQQTFERMVAEATAANTAVATSPQPGRRASEYNPTAEDEAAEIDALRHFQNQTALPATPAPQHAPRTLLPVPAPASPAPLPFLAPEAPAPAALLPSAAPVPLLPAVEVPVAPALPVPAPAPVPVPVAVEVTSLAVPVTFLAVAPEIAPPRPVFKTSPPAAPAPALLLPALVTDARPVAPWTSTGTKSAVIPRPVVVPVAAPVAVPAPAPVTVAVAAPLPVIETVTPAQPVIAVAAPLPVIETVAPAQPEAAVGVGRDADDGVNVLGRGGSAEGTPADRPGLLPVPASSTQTFVPDYSDPVFQQMADRVDPVGLSRTPVVESNADSAVLASLFTTRAPAPVAVSNVDYTIQGEVVVNFASKGGVGKSSFTMALAQRAAELGLRTVVVDMNRGQADLRSYLRLDDPTLPSIYNAALSGNPSDAFLTPTQLNAARHPSLAPLLFGAVLAPPYSLADPAIVTAAVYGRMVKHLHEQADIVFIDTQIIEARDTSGLIDGIVIPSLLGGAWGVGLTDMSKPGLENLLTTSKDFITRGINRDRILLAVNRAQTFDDADRAAIEGTFNRYATFVGAVGDDQNFANNLNMGVVDVVNSTLLPVIDSILYRVTEDERFAPQSSKKRRWGFRR